MKSGKELMHEWYERVWNRGEEDAVFELMHESCEMQGLDLPERGPEGFLQFYKGFAGAFENMRIELIELVEEEGHVAGFAKFTGQHKKSGRDVELVYATSGKWENGVVVSTREIVDFGSLLSQIGAAELPALFEAM